MTEAEMKRAENNIKTTTERVNPEYAQKLLDGNRLNRPIHHKTVLTFAEAMQNGQWANNGQGIILAPNARILDGQKRLHAVIKSGVTISINITRGVLEKDFNTMDIGKIRSNSDYHALEKRPHPKTLSTTIKNVAMYYSGHGRQMGSGASRCFTPRQSFAVLDEHKGISDSVEFAMENWKGTPLPHSSIATLHYLFTQIDMKKGVEFMERLSKGNIAEANSPILKLRNFLYSRKAELKARGMSMHKAHQYGIVIKAWNAWVQGKTLSDFDLKKGEEFPKAISPKK